jgi:hypothetical protein
LLLRPGRLERLVFAEPPNCPPRLQRTAGKSVPMNTDVTAMRLSIDAAGVTAEDVAKPTKSSGGQRIC